MNSYINKYYILLIIIIYLLINYTINLIKVNEYYNPIIDYNKNNIAYDYIINDINIVLSKQYKLIEDSTYIILFFNGNSDNVRLLWNDYTKIQQTLISKYKLDIEICAFDYKGYGKSTFNNNLTPRSLLDDGLFVANWLSTNYNNKIIYHGYSMGCSVASYVSNYIKPHCLILKSPFYNLRSMALIKYDIPFIDVIVGDDYNTVKYLKNLDKNKIIIGHSKTDETIPFNNAKLLQKYCKKFIILHGNHSYTDLSDDWIDNIYYLF